MRELGNLTREQRHMENHVRRVLAGGGVAMLLALAGCEMGGAQPERAGVAPLRQTADFAMRRIEGAGVAEVQPVADRVFRSYFRLDSMASSALDWVARPTEVGEHEAGGEGTAEPSGGPQPKDTVADMLGVAPRRYRRTAELRLVAADHGVLAQVRVMRQRLTSTEQAAFARERGDDRPTDTAIDRLGPTSTAPRQEWRDDRRDRKLEQEILNAIQAGLATTRPASG